MSQTQQALPIYRLFRKSTTKRIMDFFLEHPDEWFRKTDLQDTVSMNHESIRQNLGSGDHPGLLEDYGVVKRSAWDVNMPRYKLRESPVVDFLEEYDGYPFRKFFTSQARRDVFMFFMREANDGQLFTRNAVSETTATNYDVVEEVMNQLAEAGTLEKNDKGYSVEYQYVPDNELEQSIVRFNNIIYDTYHDIVENYPDSVDV